MLDRDRLNVGNRYVANHHVKDLSDTCRTYPHRHLLCRYDGCQCSCHRIMAAWAALGS